jgi:hypothetical protein
MTDDYKNVLRTAGLPSVGMLKASHCARRH